MKSTTIILHAILGLSFVAALAIGLAFWAGHLLDLFRFHVALGALFSITLIALAIFGAFRGVSPRRAVTLMAFAIAVVALGMIQTQLLPGPWHWLVRVLHLGLGIGAAIQGFAMARLLRSAVAPRGTDAIRSEQSVREAESPPSSG